jgi:hypothetical protein
VLRDPLTFQPLLYFPDWTRALRDLAFDCVSRRLAVAATDSDLELWNIAALEDGLAKDGLAWNPPAPAGAPARTAPGRPLTSSSSGREDGPDRRQETVTRYQKIFMRMILNRPPACFEAERSGVSGFLPRGTIGHRGKRK